MHSQEVAAGCISGAQQLMRHSGQGRHLHLHNRCAIWGCCDVWQARGWVCVCKRYGTACREG